MSDHSMRGLYHTGVAYTWYECTTCGEEAGSPRGFSEGCAMTPMDEMMTNSDYIMTCPECDTDVMVEDSSDAPDVSCGCQKGHGPMMDVLKVVGRNE